MWEVHILRVVEGDEARVTYERVCKHSLTFA